jgi:trans-2,3-dihydro-3-hydroxyanthranilate isomerase
MARTAFRLVDVFTERPFAGNQLCVVPEPVSLPPRAMQALAREIGFSETTFVSEAAGDRYAMRIFTPEAELPFAGHPTLGTAFVLVTEGRVGSPATQVTVAGEVSVEVEADRGFATMHQLPPTFGDEVYDVDAVALAIGLTTKELHPDLLPRVVGTGLEHLMVPLADVAAVEHASCDIRRTSRVLAEIGVDGLYMFALDERGAKARLFAPAVGVVEDPATGSAAGPLGAYLAANGLGGMPGSILVRQGEEIGRPSELHVTVYPEGDSWRVSVAGGVVVVGEGWFDAEPVG